MFNQGKVGQIQLHNELVSEKRGIDTGYVALNPSWKETSSDL